MEVNKPSQLGIALTTFIIQGAIRQNWIAKYHIDIVVFFGRKGFKNNAGSATLRVMHRSNRTA
jgi:hypothetical protein